MAAAAAAQGSPVAAAPSKDFFTRLGRPIGLQLYTLGDEPKKDLEGTLRRVAEIGYRDIELPGLFSREPPDLRRAADAAGLAISSLHVPAAGAGVSVRSEPQALADLAGALGVRQLVVPMFPLPPGLRLQPGVALETAITQAVVQAGEDMWKRLAQLLNERAAALAPHGITLSYHNHSVEFLPIGTGTGWDILARETDPRLVYFEIDIGWVSSAGLDPVAFFGRHRGRVRQVHVKDVAKGFTPSQALVTSPAEVGSGVVDWARVLPAAYAAGARHFYVEQEPPFTLSRLESIARSYTYLSKLRA
ncbi:sugar phosphate isomerase/epimerase family protein [Caulobacter rhizosphaerae]|uniref:sugar phosphate isomerase/epimerase family protein n=1 Tax=Caulobacter rhizosphaerae TaxID=2010972 RepID=UPI0013D64A13|nr:sugar phosphate isomerase/epimerase [Caulobacter rhizosphaerae]